MDELKPNVLTKMDHYHRVQSLWQIWLPLGVVLLLTVGFFCATMLVTQSGSMNLGQVQNAAIILLTLPLAIIGVVSLIALVVVIYGTSRIFPFIPRLRVISQQLDSISSNITIWSNRVILPFVLARSLRNRLASKKHK